MDAKDIGERTRGKCRKKEKRKRAKGWEGGRERKTETEIHTERQTDGERKDREIFGFLLVVTWSIK